MEKENSQIKKYWSNQYWVTSILGLRDSLNIILNNLSKSFEIDLESGDIQKELAEIIETSEVLNKLPDILSSELDRLELIKQNAILQEDKAHLCEDLNNITLNYEELQSKYNKSLEDYKSLYESQQPIYKKNAEIKNCQNIIEGLINNKKELNAEVGKLYEEKTILFEKYQALLEENKTLKSNVRDLTSSNICFHNDLNEVRRHNKNLSELNKDLNNLQTVLNIKEKEILNYQNIISLGKQDSQKLFILNSELILNNDKLLIQNKELEIQVKELLEKLNNIPDERRIEKITQMFKDDIKDIKHEEESRRDTVINYFEKMVISEQKKLIEFKESSQNAIKSILEIFSENNGLYEEGQYYENN